jgi:putative transposase
MQVTRDPLYRRHRFPAEVISYAVWLYFRFPLSLRMVEEMLAARGICVTYETVRQWGKKFGRAFADQIRQRAPARGDKWHMDEVVVSIAGEQHWLWRAVDQNGFVLDVLVQRRRDSHAAQRFLSVHDQVANLFHIPYPESVAADFRRAAQKQAFAVWREISKAGATA